MERARSAVPDCGASSLYTLAHLASASSPTLLAVSGSAVLGKGRGFGAEQSKRRNTVFRELAEGALEAAARVREAGDA